MIFKMSNGPEKRVENKIKKKLTLCDFYYNKNFGGALSKDGRPDIEGVAGPYGQYFAIEVKRIGSLGIPSVAQLRNLQRISRNGGLAFISCSDKVVDYIQHWVNSERKECADLNIDQVVIGELSDDSVSVWKNRKSDIVQIIDYK